MKRWEVTLKRGDRRAIIGPIPARDAEEAVEEAMYCMDYPAEWQRDKVTELVSV